MSNSKAYRTYEISQNEYRELKYFCLRYGEMKKELARIYALKPPDSSGAYSTTPAKPTETGALKALKLSENIALIDRALEMAAEEPVRGILKRSVITPNVSYNSFFSIPMGRQQFFEMRRRFFYILKLLRETYYAL